MQQFSIQRDDGLGNQLCNRMLSEVWSSYMPGLYNYVHSTAHRVAHINFGVPLLELTNYIDSIFFPDCIRQKQGEEVATYTTLAKAVGDEILREFPTHFPRSDFLKYKEHFQEKTKNLDLTTDYIAIHIRRGDFVRLNERRLKSDEYYIRVADKLRSYDNTLNIIIETDSPEQVQQLARKMNAQINVTTEQCDQLIKTPCIEITEEYHDIWIKLIKTIQSIRNLANSKYLIPSVSGFSNISHILGRCHTVFPIGIFCRHHSSKQCDRIQKYITTRGSVKDTIKWPVTPWGDYKYQMEEMVGPLYRIYNFSFLKDSESTILEEL